MPSNLTMETGEKLLALLDEVLAEALEDAVDELPDALDAPDAGLDEAPGEFAQAASAHVANATAATKANSFAICLVCMALPFPLALRVV